MRKIYNLKFRPSDNDEWSYMQICGSDKDVLMDINTLREMGFKHIVFGHFELENGKEVKTCIKNVRFL